MWTAVLCSLLVVFVTRILWRRWRYDLHKVPTPPGWPILGHTPDFLCGNAIRNPAKYVGQGLKYLNYPKLMRIDAFGKASLVVTDDEFIRNTLLSNTDPFPRDIQNTAFFLPMIGNNPQARSLFLHAEATPYVKAVRRVYLNAFQSNNLKMAMPKINDVMRKMISVIEAARENGPIEVQKLFVSMTLDAIGSIAFDENLGGLDGSREMHDLILAAGYVIGEALFNPLKAVYAKLFPNSKAGRHRTSVIGRLYSEWKWLTDEILSRDDPANGEEPIWYGLKHLTDPETKKPLDYDLLLAEVAGVVVAAMDTTGHQLAWIFALLATRPDVMRKILDELEQHGLYGRAQRDLQFDDLSNLDYLGAVVKEGMRVAHIVAFPFRREVPKDMIILGYRIPKGTLISRASNRAFNIDTDWNDPDSFKPERWLSNEAICRSRNIQFSSGPRDCPGQKLAMLEMRVIIVVILQKYEVSLVGSYADLADNTVEGLVTEAENGIWLSFAPRNTF